MAALAALLLAPAFSLPALASTASEQQQGAAILRSLGSGKAECRDLSSEDFDHVGEYVMSRMAGSTAAHERMNQLMQGMMGSAGERQMHVVMGRRFSDCGGGAVPSSFGAMMGMMGAMGGFQGGRGSVGNSSMMGGRSMMGGSYRSGRGGENDDSWSAANTVMVVLMLLVLLALVVTAAALLRRGPGRARTAQQILAGRYAKGEIDTEEYKRRFDALGGE